MSEVSLRGSPLPPHKLAVTLQDQPNATNQFPEAAGWAFSKNLHRLKKKPQVFICLKLPWFEVSRLWKNTDQILWADGRTCPEDTSLCPTRKSYREKHFPCDVVTSALATASLKSQCSGFSTRGKMTETWQSAFRGHPKQGAAPAEGWHPRTEGPCIGAKVSAFFSTKWDLCMKSPRCKHGLSHFQTSAAIDS